MTKAEALNTLMKMRAWRAWGKEQKEEERPEMPEQKEVDEAFDVCIKLFQEQPEVDLEKEIKNYLATKCAGDDEPSVSEIARHFYELGCLHAAVLYDDIEFERQRREEEEPTIKGWVARDENGELWFHHLEPMRDGGKWNFGGGGFKMVEDIYPTLSWHDEPIEVELTISRVVKNE